MPNAQGALVPGDPGYVPPVGGQPGIINSATTVAVDAPGTPVTASSGVAPTTFVAPAPAESQVITPPPTPPTPPAPAALTPDQTVQGRVKNIIDENSPLMQQAMARAAAKANDRGLLNSSLAVGAGQAAVLDAATPIATADAQSSTQLALGNQQAQTQRYTADLAAKTQTDMQAVDNAFKTTFQTADTAAKLKLQEAHDLVTKDIAQVEANYKTLMQSSASATEVYRTTMSNIANIFADTSISAGDKATVINGYLGWMKQSMNLIGSVNGVDLTGLTDFGSVAAQP